MNPVLKLSYSTHYVPFKINVVWENLMKHIISGAVMYSVQFKINCNVSVVQ